MRSPRRLPAGPCATSLPWHREPFVYSSSPLARPSFHRLQAMWVVDQLVLVVEAGLEYSKAAASCAVPPFGTLAEATIDTILTTMGLVHGQVRRARTPHY